MNENNELNYSLMFSLEMFPDLWKDKMNRNIREYMEERGKNTLQIVF